MFKLFYPPENVFWNPAETSSDVIGFGIEKEFVVLKDGLPVKVKSENGIKIHSRLKKVVSSFPKPKHSTVTKQWEGKDAEWKEVILENLDEAIGAGYLMTPEYLGGPKGNLMGVEIRTLPCDSSNKPVDKALHELSFQEKLLREAFGDGEFNVVPIPVHTKHEKRPVFVSPSMHMHFSVPQDIIDDLSKLKYREARGMELNANPKTRRLLALHSYASSLQFIFPLVAAFASNSIDDFSDPSFYDYKASTYLPGMSRATIRKGITPSLYCTPRSRKGTVEFRTLDSMVTAEDLAVPISLAAAFNSCLIDSWRSENEKPDDAESGVAAIAGGPGSMITLENMKRVAEDGVGAKLLAPYPTKDLEYVTSYCPGMFKVLYNSGTLADIGIEKGWFRELSIQDFFKSIEDSLRPHLKQVGTPDRVMGLLFSADKSQSYNQEQIGSYQEAVTRAIDDARKGSTWFAKKPSA